MRYLYLCYGRAGLECLNLLLNRLKSSNDLIVFTYDSHENKELLKTLNEKKLQYYLTPLSNEDSYNIVKAFSPDYILSIHYRDLIPERILKLSKNPGLNLHPSLLPKYAGCLATMWVIINGEKETGITYHLLTEKFDDGNVILQEKILISSNETGESLFNKAIDLGVKYFNDALDLIEKGEKGKPQSGTRSYYSRKVPYDGKIAPEWSDQRIDHFIRSFIFTGKEPAHCVRNGTKYPIYTLEEYKELMETK